MHTRVVSSALPLSDFWAAAAPGMLSKRGYVRDTCKKVSQGCETRLDSDPLDHLTHHRTADTAGSGSVNLANTPGRRGR